MKTTNAVPEKVIVSLVGGAEELCRAAAEAWMEAVIASAPSQERFTTGLSGGRIAQTFFAALVASAREKSAGGALERVHFFWADERCVPPEDTESNFRIANEVLFRPLGIAEGQIHRIRGEELPERAAELAREDITANVQLNERGVPALDLLILGMGEDGHVASLFPGEPAAAMSSPEVYRAVTGPKPPPNRVTLGYEAITAARQAWVLVAGEAKQSALRASVRPNSVTPLGRVLRQRTLTTLFTDIRLE